MIREIHSKLLNHETTAVKLTEEYFDRIEKNDSQIGAYLSLRKEKALNEAYLADEKIAQGDDKKIDLLCGIPCAIKDNILIKGSPTTAGSKMLENYRTPYDATVIKKIKESGAIILGKTNMDEFAMGSSTELSAFKITKNPADLTRVPGGSSGGSAAAVASYECVWALGSDTGGSIRQPAAFCGVVGLKPTYGLVSRYGLIAMASSLDQIGPITQTVEDAAIVLSRIAGVDGKDATSAKSVDKYYEDEISRGVEGLKIGLPKEYFQTEGLDDKIKKKVYEAAEKFQSIGAEIYNVSLPSSEFAIYAYYLIMPSEVSSNLARFDGIKYGQSLSSENSIDLSLLDIYNKSRKEYFGPEVKRRIMLGTYALSAGYWDQYYLKAQKVRALIKKEFENVFSKVDLILGPTTPTPAFKIGEKIANPVEMYLADIYTVTANIAGVPAISVPAGTVNLDQSELPIAIQLTGKWFDEELLLAAACAYETA